MVNILYICKDEKPKIDILPECQIDRLHLIGKRYDKVLIEKDCDFDENQELEIRCLQYQDVENWRETLK